MVEKAAEPRISELRRRAAQLAKAMTTPLVPDDYLELLNPAWSARELTGTVVRSHPRHRAGIDRRRPPVVPVAGPPAGPYLRIGAELNEISRHWRAYSLTSDPDHPEGFVSITVKYVEEGLMSPWFTRKARPTSSSTSATVRGDSAWPPAAAASLITSGAAHHSIGGMPREIERRESASSTHVTSTRAREPDLASSAATCRRMAGEYTATPFTSS